MKINLEADNYYTQRNNIIEPYFACMPTARVMFYLGNNLEYKNQSFNKFKREYADDDYFMALLNTPQAKDYAKVKYPWSYENGKEVYPPNQIHGMYSTYLDTILFGKKKTDFITNLTFENYKERILSGQVLMTSGAFGKITGHAYCVIGIDDEDNFIIADPFGNFHTDYSDPKGYGIKMSKEEFITHAHPAGESLKWGHIIL